MKRVVWAMVLAAGLMGQQPKPDRVVSIMAERFTFNPSKVTVTQAGELNRRLAFVTGVNPNVASVLRGYYVEPGWHLFPRRTRFDLIAFGRYERYNTQHRMPAGYTALPQFNRSSWVMGLTFKPHADVAVKFDYVFNRNRSAVVKPVDGVNFGIGWWF